MIFGVLGWGVVLFCSCVRARGDVVMDYEALRGCNVGGV